MDKLKKGPLMIAGACIVLAAGSLSALLIKSAVASLIVFLLCFFAFIALLMQGIFFVRKSQKATEAEIENAALRLHIKELQRRLHLPSRVPVSL